jgi:hypothetical protein
MAFDPIFYMYVPTVHFPTSLPLNDIGRLNNPSRPDRDSRRFAKPLTSMITWLPWIVSWRMPGNVLAWLATTITWLCGSVTGKNLVEQDTESDQQVPSPNEEGGHGNHQEYSGSKTYDVGSPLLYLTC